MRIERHVFTPRILALLVVSAEMFLRGVQKSSTREIVIHDALRIVVAEAYIGRRQHASWRFPGRMNVFRGHVGEFGHPPANIVTVGIELLSLRDRIEDAEPRLCIAA